MSWLYDAVSSVSDAVSSAVGTVTDTVHSTVTAAGRAVGGLKYTRPLGDKELTRLLAACAANVYQHSGAEGGPTKYLGNSLECIKRASCGSGLDRKGLDYVSYAVYKVKAGRHAGATILAFEGTNSYTHGIQDLVGVAFARFGPIASVACNIYNSIRPTYITGHSLGGCIAEVVCSRSGCAGASFNAPGPWSPHPATCIADGDRYNDARFEIHLANGDPVSCMCNPGAGGADHGHIGSKDNGALVWHYNCGGQHSIDVMVRAINSW